jgi:hypothetical protein
MKNRRQTFALTCSVLALGLARPAIASGCFEYTGKSETVSVSIAGAKSADMRIVYYEALAREMEEAGKIACEARISVPLSAFPTLRLATRPGELAATIRYIAADWEARECRISVWRENDIAEEPIPEDEQCIAGDFRYEGGAWWPSSAERSCDELGSRDAPSIASPPPVPSSSR